MQCFSMTPVEQCNLKIKKSPAGECEFLKNDSVKAMYFLKMAPKEQCNVLKNNSIGAMHLFWVTPTEQ